MSNFILNKFYRRFSLHDKLDSRNHQNWYNFYIFNHRVLFFYQRWNHRNENEKKKKKKESCMKHYLFYRQLVNWKYKFFCKFIFTYSYQNTKKTLKSHFFHVTGVYIIVYLIVYSQYYTPGSFLYNTEKKTSHWNNFFLLLCLFFK